MNKSDLIEHISKKHSFAVKETAKILQSFIDTVSEELSNNNKVKITGFGTFYISKRKARQIVHPRDTSKYIQLDETYKPSFRPTSKFIKKIKN